MTDPQPAQQNPPATSTASTSIAVPDDIRQKFPQLIELILASESMNNEERQYWVNILPIMTPEQLTNLKEILVNEREQLAAIDAKYSKEISQLGQQQFVVAVGEERRKRREERSAAEEKAAVAEDQATENLLNQIDAA